MKIATFLLPASCLLLSTSLVRAVIVTYTVDSTLSSLTVGGNASGAPLTAQTAGADKVAYKGTVTGDLSGGILTLTGGSSLVAGLNTVAPFIPAPSGSAVDNYGVFIAGSANNGAIAFRDLQFDLPSGNITSGSPTTAPFQFTAGFADYNIPSIGAPGTLPLAPASSANAAAGSALISTAGGTETLTFPVSLSYVAGGGVTITYTGNITATRAIPEPAAPALTLLGLVGVTAARRRRA